METTLRPLTLGEILDRTAQLYRTHFLLFLGIAAPYTSLALLVNLAAVTYPELFRSGRMSAAATWSLQIGSWAGVLLMLLVSNVSAAAYNRAVAWVHLGEPATIRGAYRSILPKTGRYLGLGALKLLLAWAPLILLFAAFQGFYVYFQLKGILPRPGEAPHAGTPNPAIGIFGIVSIVLFLVMWPFLIYAMFMALRYALALPASVVENLTPRAALKRSVSLSKGARGRILLLWLLATVIEVIVLLTTQSLFVAYSLSHHAHMPLGLRIAQQMVSFLTNTFVGPIIAIGTALFYYDQRVRKEGYDIEWMMSAAGLESRSAAAPELHSAVVEMPALPTDVLSPGDMI